MILRVHLLLQMRPQLREVCSVTKGKTWYSYYWLGIVHPIQNQIKCVREMLLRHERISKSIVWPFIYLVLDIHQIRQWNGHSENTRNTTKRDFVLLFICIILFCNDRSTLLRNQYILDALKVNDDKASIEFSFWSRLLLKCLRRMASSTSSSKQLHRIELLIALILDDKNICIALMMDFTSDKGIRFLSYNAFPMGCKLS